MTTADAERLYVQWQRVGDTALAETNSAPAFSDVPTRLIVYELPWRYHQFGRLPGAA